MVKHYWREFREKFWKLLNSGSICLGGGIKTKLFFVNYKIIRIIVSSKSKGYGNILFIHMF